MEKVYTRREITDALMAVLARKSNSVLPPHPTEKKAHKIKTSYDNMVIRLANEVEARFLVKPGSEWIGEKRILTYTKKDVETILLEILGIKARNEVRTMVSKLDIDELDLRKTLKLIAFRSKS